MSWTARKFRRADYILLLGVCCVCFLLASQRTEAQEMFSSAGYAPQYGVIPSGYSGSQAASVSYGHPAVQSYPFAGGVMPGVSHYGRNGMVMTQVPDAVEEFEPLPIENFIKDAVRNAWFRTEYMNWSIQRPGNALLGTPTLLNANPREPFTVTGGTARVVDLERIDLNDNNGIRMTLGIPLKHGTLESKFFILGHASDNVIPEQLPANGSGAFIGTTVFLDGQPTSFLRFYDESFRASFTSDIWSGEINVVLDPLNAPASGVGLKIQPLIGVRFVSVHEQLLQVGVFNDDGALPDQVTLIDSDVMNNLYGINLGLRAELVHEYFTVGVVPKVSLGMNTYRAQVITENFVSTTDPRLLSRTDESDFAAVLDLSLYGQVNITENITIFASYGIMWISRLARPHDTIEYNVNGLLGIPVSSAFKAQEQETNIWLQGITVGGEIRFR